MARSAGALADACATLAIALLSGDGQDFAIRLRLDTVELWFRFWRKATPERRAEVRVVWEKSKGHNLDGARALDGRTRTH